MHYNGLKKSIKINTVILLQPTSPFRSLRTINKMLNIYKQNKKSVVTVTTDLKKNKKKLFMNKNKILMENKFNNKKIIPVNIAGNIYINSIQNLKKYKDFVNRDTTPYLIKNKKELVDIDTNQDFKKAINLFQKYNEENFEQFKK